MVYVGAGVAREQDLIAGNARSYKTKVDDNEYEQLPLWQ